MSESELLAGIGIVYQLNDARWCVIVYECEVKYRVDGGLHPAAAWTACGAGGAARPPHVGVGQLHAASRAFTLGSGGERDSRRFASLPGRCRPRSVVVALFP